MSGEVHMRLERNEYGVDAPCGCRLADDSLDVVAILCDTHGNAFKMQRTLRTISAQAQYERYVNINDLVERHDSIIQSARDVLALIDKGGQ
jgi:hypothetical protein